MTQNQKQDLKWVITPVMTIIGGVIFYVASLSSLQVEVKNLKDDVQIIKSQQTIILQQLLKSNQYEKSTSNYQGNSEKRTANYSNSGASD